MSIGFEAEYDQYRLACELSGVTVSAFVRPDEHDVVLGGIRLHYLDWGGQGPSIVFLHGGGLNAHSWDLVCLALRPNFHCYALDLRGHGDSEWSPVMDYSFEANSRDLAMFIVSLRLDAPVVVGNSLGGLTAIRYASEFAGRLAGLVLVDVGPNVRSDGVDRILRFMQLPADLESVEAYVERAVEFNPRRDRRLLALTLRHNLRQLPNGHWTWKYDRRHRMTTNGDEQARRNAVLWPAVGKITCPTLIVRGARSQVFSDDDAARLAAAIPSARWTRVLEAGHTVQGDNPGQFTSVLRGFLSELSLK
jgi:pimeloyl-ACP methyl ester carboxylesterase